MLRGESKMRIVLSADRAGVINSATGKEREEKEEERQPLRFITRPLTAINLYRPRLIFIFSERNTRHVCTCARARVLKGAQGREREREREREGGGGKIVRSDRGSFVRRRDR